MSNTTELLAQRLQLLEQQMADLMANNTTHPTKTHKNQKKEKNSPSDDDTPKKKRVSGYILFGKAERDNVKALLEADTHPDNKVKSTEVMKRLGQLWKDLPDATRDEWNAKAKQLENDTLP